MKTSLVIWALKAEARDHERSLSPVAAEIFGARFMRLLGIGAPNVKLVSRTEASTLGREWIRKFATDDGRVLVLEKIPGAISLDHLNLLYGIASEPVRFDWNPSEMKSPLMAPLAAFSVSNTKRLLDEGKPWKIINARRFFDDFALPSTTAAIRDAIQWNSEPRMRINAARLVLGISTAHSGNVLADANAKLYSIDHETATVSDGHDVELLAENLRKSSLAESVIRSLVSRLRARDIDLILDGLPELPWAMGSKRATAAYFKNRLALFQKHFSLWR